jgi:uncharacterized protein DUF3618
MAGNSRTAEQVRRDIAVERDQLADAVDELRADLDVGDKLRGRLPALAAGALGAGFLVAGGIGATMRFIARRGRDGKEKARVGPFSLSQRG